MRRLLGIILLATLLAPAACDEDMYRVRMHVTSDGAVRREVTFSREDLNQGKRSVPETEVERLGAIYGKPVSRNSERVTFAGEFRDSMPADLTDGTHASFGFVRRTSSRMGRSLSYVERMPGPTDLRAFISACEQLYDAYIRIMLAYFAQQPELKDHPEKRAALEQFAKGELRHDTLNVLQLWIVGLNQTAFAEQKGVEAATDEYSVLLLASMYLIERDYVRPTDYPSLDDKYHKWLFRGVLRRAAAAMGHPADAPLPPVLARLLEKGRHTEAFETGRTAIGMSEEEFQALVEPTGIATGGHSAQYNVIWHDTDRPAVTNGEYKEASRELHWHADNCQLIELPAILFATWANANETFQKQHFGRVVLVGEPLKDYNRWRSELSPDHRAEWDKFVDSLEPGPGLIERLRRFRFAGDEAKSEPPAGAALLVEKMEEGRVIPPAR